MKSFVVFVVIGLVVALIGVAVLVAATGSHDHPLVYTIISGDTRYVRYSFSIIAAGSVAVSYLVYSGTVNVWIMTDAQHTEFIQGGTLSYLAASSGSSGSLAADLPSGGTYFVETGHGSGSEFTEQSGREDVTITGMATTSFVAGVGAIAVGVILLGIGAWWRTRPERPAVPTWSTPPPYVPPGGYGPPSMPGYGVPPPSSLPAFATGPPPTPPPGVPSTVGSLLVTIENAAATDETVEVLANGVSVASLQVPAGGSGQANVRLQIPSQYGSMVTVEAVTQDGRRTQQPVSLRGDTVGQVTLRIG